MSLLNDEKSVSVLEGGTLIGPILRLSRRTTEDASHCISDLDEVALPVRQRGLTDSYIGIGATEMGRYNIITSRIADALRSRCNDLPVEM